jgi:hypothetical protein
MGAVCPTLLIGYDFGRCRTEDAGKMPTVLQVIRAAGPIHLGFCRLSHITWRP